MELKKVILITTLVLVSCASTYPFRFYVLDIDEMMLRGEKSDDDLSVEVCKKDKKYNCAVYLFEEHENLMKDYLRIKEELKDCQSGKRL